MPNPQSPRNRTEKGLRFPAVDREITNRSGGAWVIGDVIQLDLTQSESEVTSVAFGEDASIWANAINPTAAGVQGSIMGVVVETDGIADNATGTVRFQGVVDQAYVIKATGNIAIGDKLVATTARNLDADRASNEMIIGRSLEAKTTPTTRTLAKVWFDGINGFGIEP